MTLINLDKSYFKCLKSAETDSAAGDGGGGGDLGDGVQNLKNLVQQIVGELDKSDKLDTCQLLARPSVVSLIDKFIRKHEESDSVSSNKKNSEKSAEYRKRGNEEYGLGNFSTAVYYYTMAIIYAPDVPEKVDGNANVDDNVDDNNVPEKLSLAYGNRSAVFYELGQYEAALTDIDHSLATGYPRENQSELLLLKVECFISLKQLGEAKSVLEQLSIIAEPKDVRALKTRLQLLDINSNVDVYPSQKQSATDQLLPVLNYLTRTGRYEPSPDFASLSSKVEPQYSHQKGRHLVAKQNIEPGDILLVESPFASVLGKHFEYHFCHHCYRKLETNIGNEDDGECCIAGSVIPCTECTRVLYCSTDCRTAAWRTYHQFECSILPILYKMSHSSHLSLRMLLSTGLDVIQQVSDQDVNDNESKNRLSSLKLSDPEDSAQHYKLVHSLIDLQHLIPPEKFVEFVIISAVLLQLTKKCTAFVRTAEQINLAATALLRHLLLVNANSSRLANFQFIGSDQDDGDVFAIGLYPYHSALLNYSCEPNSMSTHVHSTVLIQRANKRIAAGSDVTVPVDSYVSVMGKHLTARREHLWNVYHFWCECSRCVLEERDGMDGKYFPIGCIDCGSALTRASSSTDIFHCSSSSCTSSMSLSEARQLYARIESKFATAEGRILSFETSSRPEKNFEHLLGCEGDLTDLSAIQGLRNCWQLVELLRRLSVAFQSINLQARARKHLERLCEISEALHGLDGAPATQLNLINLFIESGPDDDDDDDDGGGGDDSGQPISVHWFEKLRRIAQRTIEIVRLILLAEAEPPATDDEPDDLLADDSRTLREVHTILKNLIDYCKENEE